MLCRDGQFSVNRSQASVGFRVAVLNQYRAAEVHLINLLKHCNCNTGPMDTQAAVRSIHEHEKLLARRQFCACYLSKSFHRGDKKLAWRNHILENLHRKLFFW